MITPIIESRLDDRMLRRLEEAYKKAEGSYVTIGVHEGKRGYTKANAPTVGQVALWMEYGAPNAGVPARPFLGPAMANNRAAIASLLGRDLALLAYDKISVKESLTDIGRQVKLFIQASIQSGPGEPLSGTWDPPTGYLGRKRALNQPSQTLIATGTMLASIDYRVELGDNARQQVAEGHAPAGGAAPMHHNAERRAQARMKAALSRGTHGPRAGRDEQGRFISRKNKP